jgi:VCBS repeat-containing protein
MNKNKSFFSIKHVPTWFRAFLMAAFTLTLITLGAEATTISKTNNTAGSADGSVISRAVTINVDDFAANSVINDVNIAVAFEKTDGSCAAPGSGFAYNGEIYMYLMSPSGTKVVLVESTTNSAGSGNGVTYDGIEDGGPVTVTFNDEAALGIKSEIPTTGSFIPEQLLSAFDDEDPVGVWTLYVGDNLLNDPLCFQQFSLTVSAVQTPVMDDQSFNIAEGSAVNTSVGTIAATDNDPGEKLNFQILSSLPSADFSLDSLTGEIKVANPLDYETAPTYTLNVQVTDSSGLSDTATITINVTNQNDPPTAVDDSYSTNEDTVLNVPAAGVLGNDDDPDGDTLTVTPSPYNTTSAQGATVTVNADGSFTYDPTGASALQALAEAATVDDTFTYTMTDGTATDSATVTITVTGIDDAPDAVDDADTTPEETAVTISVLTNDSDPEGDVISITGITQGTNGTVVDNGNGTLTYTPDTDFAGVDSFTYTITANGKTDTATVTVTVTNQNDPPTAYDDSYPANEDNVLTVTDPGVLSNDTDPDVGDTLTVTPSPYNTTSAQGATVTVNADGSFSYDPTNATALQALAPGETVDDTFSYTVSDGNLTDSATVTITVSGIDDAPTAVDDADTTPEETAVTISVLTNDSDPEGDAISITDITQGTNGTVVDNGNGTLTYTPDTDFVGQDSFTYEITANGKTDTATVTVTVTNQNDLPTANDDSYSANEDTVLNVPADGVLGNDTDPDTGDTLTVTPSPYNTTSTQGAAVTVNADGSFSYDPTNATALQALAEAATVDDTFTYTMTDGTATDSATVTITVTGIDDAPDAVDDADTTPEETAVTISVLTNDSDAEGDAISITGITQGTNGTVVDNGNGTLTYTPDTDFAGVDSFTYTITANGKTDTATVTVTVTNQNDAPTDITLSNSSVAENQSSGTLVGNLSTTDPDSGDSFTYSLVAGAGDTGNGSFQIVGSQLQTAATFDFEAQPTYSIRVQTRDSGGLTFDKEFTITVTDANDLPVAVDDTYTTNEDTALNVAAPGVLANDTDEDHDTLSVLTADSASGQGASVNVAADGGFTYDPTAVTALQVLNVGENVADTFTYTVRDGGLIFDTATVTVTVTGVNDAPVAVDDVVTTMLETAVIVSPLTNDTDPDTTDTMNISGFTQGIHGAVANNGNGTLTYTPATGYSGSDSFTYTIQDSHSANDTATVNVTVNPETYYVFLPLALNNYISAPDLVITSLQGSSDYVEVVIENQGNQTTGSGFWVDFYVNPVPPPVAANELWPNLSGEGIAWGVTTSIAPGQVLTLTYSTASGAPNLYYSADDSLFSGSLPVGTLIYAQVDSAHVGHLNGAIEENHEITGDTYNNIFQAVATAVTPTNIASTITTLSAPSAILPTRH